ncbi:hypothetical protein L8P05_10745 [Enterobacter cloacae]|uniref:hypothetical protein n=1 Tax=Enterobacter cloacae TaxID=550 RepID=UPI002006AFEF|nr:hypothetical protein [Enterobacter cloacae]MCK7174397.1 hypothetical protein [Enterobacter cloacae]
MTLEERVEALEKEFAAQKEAAQERAAFIIKSENGTVKIVDKSGATRFLLGPLW